jgi:hypothetical protein
VNQRDENELLTRDGCMACEWFRDVIETALTEYEAEKLGRGLARHVAEEHTTLAVSA